MMQLVDTLSVAHPVATSEPVAAARLLDSVWQHPLLPLTEGVSDSLATTPVARPLTAAEAFGEQSELVVGSHEALRYVEQLTDHPIFQGITLLLLAAYALMLCAHLFDFAALFSRSRESELHSHSPQRALHSAAIIGLLLLAALVVRLCETTPAAEAGTMTLLLSALGATLLLFLVQSGVLLLVGHITLTRDLSSELIARKILLFGLGSLLAAPAILLQLLIPPGEGRLWLGWVALVAGIIVILFIKESFLLFLRKKISILHWFLYLCAVECFPMSLMWLLLVRW